MRSALLVVIFCTGCTHLDVTLPNGAHLSRTSFLQRVEIPVLELRTNGTVTLKGYNSDGGEPALGIVTEAAVRGAVGALK